MIKAALGVLDDVPYRADEFFGRSSPTECPNVPNALLNPRDTWRKGDEYDAAVGKLAGLFRENFGKYAEATGPAVTAAGPVRGL